MNRTNEYFKIANAHREGLRAIWSTYNETMKRIEPYKGSSGYDADEREAARIRDNAITAQSRATANAFDKILASMREKVGGSAAVPPGDAELRLLQVLKLRDTVSREELQAAGRACRDNTMALHALDDIAQSHGYHNMYAEYPAWRDGASMNQRRIASLTESARRIVKLTKPDSRRETIQEARGSGVGVVGMQTVVVDRDFSNEREAIAFYAGLPDSDIDMFMGAVND